MEPILHVVVLEITFAGIVTDGAVDGVIQQQEFKDTPAYILDQFGISVDDHFVGHRYIARQIEAFSAAFLYFYLA